jgi:hypothetical protein
LADHVALAGGLDAVLQVVLDLRLVARVGVDDVPVKQGVFLTTWSGRSSR